jgi:hypothetical protein
MIKMMLTKRSALLSLAGSIIVCLWVVAESQATAPRAFVSINGADTNPCSAAQPCRSFNQALTVVEAGGEIVVQDSGGYSTGFTITQSVTIDAAGFNASVISTGPGNLCTINAGPSDRVVLRGISFHGAGVGANAISVSKVGSLYVEHCSISEFMLNGLDDNYGGSLLLTDTDIRACFAGIQMTAGVMPASLVAQSCRFAECESTGVAVGSLNAAATGSLTNCTASRCEDGFNLVAEASFNADLTLTNCRAFGNSNFGFGVTGGTMRIAYCVVTGNGIGIFKQSGSVIGTSSGTNLIAGNGTNGSTSSGGTLQ